MSDEDQTIAGTTSPASTTRTTIKEGAEPLADGYVASPGVLIIFSGGEPVFHALPLRRGSLELGRDELAALHITDGRVSRAHLGLSAEGPRWTIVDRGSTNGVYVDGLRLEGSRRGPAPRVLRLGRTLVLPVVDITPYALHGLEVSEGGRVIGPVLRRVLEQVCAVGRRGHNVLITGPSGSGKEIAARAFHAASGRTRGDDSPFVALNCATIPTGLAERVLFGTTKGAYSGAVSDAKGLIQAAAGGTLFLDEIADLEASIQAKLLRALETKEILPVGAVRPVQVDFTLCAATLRDLREQVRTDRFREDLYFRIGRPEFRMPTLAERPEEIPWLIGQVVEEFGNAGVDVELVESCVLRRWPGNVRELLAECRGAAIAAGAGELRLEHLPAEAGSSLDGSISASPGAKVAPVEGEAPAAEDPILAALREHDGNVSRAASQLGVSRSKVRRFVERTGVDLATLRGT